jgi:hypothetical protein
MSAHPSVWGDGVFLPLAKVMRHMRAEHDCRLELTKCAFGNTHEIWLTCAGTDELLGSCTITEAEYKELPA